MSKYMYAERCGDRGPVTIPGHVFYAKWDALRGVLPNPMCNSKRRRLSDEERNRKDRSEVPERGIW